MSSQLTKEQLKAELVNLGVPLPPSHSRKEEYEKLYKKHAPNAGDFSSDDEALPSTPVKSSGSPVVVKPSPQRRSRSSSAAMGRGTPTNTTTAPAELVTPAKAETLNEAKIRQLTDAELYDLLIEYKLPGGPIVASTRLIYEKMLLDHLNGGGGGGSQVNGSNGTNGVENGNGFSSDEEFVPTSSSSRKSLSGTPRGRGTPAVADADASEAVKVPTTTTTAAATRKLIDPKRFLLPPGIKTSEGGAAKRAKAGESVSSSTASTSRGLLSSSQTASSSRVHDKYYDIREAERQMREKYLGPEKDNFAKYAFIGLSVLILLLAIYFMVVHSEQLTEDQKIDKELDEVIAHVKAKQQQ